MQVEMTDLQIIEAMTGLMSALAWRDHPALDNSDIRPHLVGDTGCWVDPDVQGDENGPADEYIGIAFFIKDAVDDDTRMPFITGMKIHKPSFRANPKTYAMTAAMHMSRGIGKMQGEMHATAQRNSKKIKAQLESGFMGINDRLE